MQRVPLYCVSVVSVIPLTTLMNGSAKHAILHLSSSTAEQFQLMDAVNLRC